MNRFLALALLLGLGLFLPHSSRAQQWVPGGQGSPIVCAFNNTPPSISTGNFVYAQCNTQGELIISGGGGGGGGLSVQDNTAFTRGTSNMTPAGCQYNTAETSLTNGNQGTVECNVHGQQFFDVNNNSNFAAILSSTVDSANNNKTATAVNVTPINCSVSATGTAANAPNLGTATIHGFTVVNLNTANNVGINLFGTAVIGTAPTITLNAATPSYTTPPGFGANTALSVIASASTSVACWAW